MLSSLSRLASAALLALPSAAMAQYDPAAAQAQNPPAADAPAPAAPAAPAVPANQQAPAAPEPVPAANTAAAPAVLDAAMAEIAAWNAIRSSNDSADYRNFLERFPAGAFADLAQFRLRELETRRQLAAAEAAWPRVRASDELREVEDFLRLYPLSPLKQEAEALLQTLRPLTLTVHYLRRDQSLLGWSLRHDGSQTVVPFDRMDERGVIAQLSIKARQAQRRSSLSLAQGSQLDDCGGQREIRWERPREIWLLQQDCTVYDSAADAQRALRERAVPAGQRRLHFLRKDEREADWLFVLRSEKLLGGLLSLVSRAEGVPFKQRDRWGAWADWAEQEGQAAATLLLDLSDGRDRREVCDKPLRWPAQAGREAWYVAGSCTLLFSLEEAIKARRLALATDTPAR